MSASPFNLMDDSAYQRWREAKLASAPRALADLVIEVRDPRALSKAERAALLARCQSANLAIYAGPDLGEDRTVPRLLGEQLGLRRLDHNPGADEDDITALRVVTGDHRRADFIPYTNRLLHWHTDGYYNSPERQIHGLILHCVRPAFEGGANTLLDHELAYLLLRDEDPAYIAALSAPDAMTIPAHVHDGQELRSAAVGPVFSITRDGHLHLRYTARSRNIIWREEPVLLTGRSTGTLIGDTKLAIAALVRILTTNPYVLRGTLISGQGLVCNNVLHDRSGFTDDPAIPRLVYRARYYDRVAGHSH
ncbi:Taurine catabolism dioxygenase TauD [Gammaproteobacteria bacterium]